MTRQNIWFKGKDIAQILGYENPCQVVRHHIDPEDKFQRGANFDTPFINTPGGKQKAVLINESGFYSLELSSKLESAKNSKDGSQSVVLPSIRKYGQFKLFDNPNNMFKIDNETDLHCKVVQYCKVPQISPGA